MATNRTILLTNLTLTSYSGTETYIRDLSIDLMRRGHTPVVFSPQLGMISHEIRRAGIPVVDDLDALGAIPDIIHGHHSLETMAAMLRFPNTPAIFVCHDVFAWHDTPPIFPQLQNYVAVDQATYDRMVMMHSLSPEKVQTIPNAVDLMRFQPRRQLPSRPKRALVFSNYMQPIHVKEIRAACRHRDIELDVIGKNHNNLKLHPETVLPDYDLVFAKGRCALEAMACGAATIVCDVKGCGPLVTTAQFDQFRKDNFGRRLLRYPLHADFIGQQIDRYNFTDSAKVTSRVRAECGIDSLTQQLLRIYEAAINSQTHFSDEEVIAAAYEGFKWCMNNWRTMKPSQPMPQQPAKQHQQTNANRAA